MSVFSHPYAKWMLAGDEDACQWSEEGSFFRSLNALTAQCRQIFCARWELSVGDGASPVSTLFV